MKNKVSIVIPTYGRFGALIKLINSIENSNINNDLYEIIIVSSDAEDSDKVKWIRNKSNIDITLKLEADRKTIRNRSLYYYENVGIKSAKYDWILVCNDDMWVEPDWYENFLKYIEENKKVYLVSSHIGGIHLGLRIPSIGTITKNGTTETMWLYDMTIIHKSVYEEINFLDENLQWYGKGADLALAVAFLTDHKPILCDNVKINHDIIIENRVDNIGDSPLSNNHQNGGDFNYIRNKWDLWISNNNNNNAYLWNYKAKNKPKSPFFGLFNK